MKWTAPVPPFLKLNTDLVGNPGKAGGGGILLSLSGSWVAGFSLNMGITTNNIAELGTRY